MRRSDSLEVLIGGHDAVSGGVKHLRNRQYGSLDTEERVKWQLQPGIGLLSHGQNPEPNVGECLCQKDKEDKRKNSNLTINIYIVQHLHRCEKKNGAWVAIRRFRKREMRRGRQGLCNLQEIVTERYFQPVCRFAF